MLVLVLFAEYVYLLSLFCLCMATPVYLFILHHELASSPQHFSRHIQMLLTIWKMQEEEFVLNEGEPTKFLLLLILP